METQPIYMTQGRAVEAYKVLLRLSNQEMDALAAWNLYQARQALESRFKFQLEQENALLESVHAAVNPDGTVRFEKEADEALFREKMRSLSQMDAPYTGPAVILSARSGLRLTPNEIAALEGILTLRDAE